MRGAEFTDNGVAAGIFVLGNWVIDVWGFSYV